MFFYLVIYIVISFLSIGLTISKNKWIYILGIVSILSIVAACRYGIGTDYFFTYLPTYQDYLAGGGKSEIFDIGVYAIYQFCITLNLGFQFILFILSLLTMLFFMIGIENFSKKLNIQEWTMVIPFALFYYQMSFNYVRQVLAMSIIFFGCSLSDENKPVKYLVLVSSMLFHKSSVIFICFYLLRKLFSKKDYFIFQVIVLCAGVFFTIRNEIFLPFILKTPFRVYASYFKNVSLSLSFGYFVRLLPLILCLIFYRNKEKQQDIYLFIYALAISAILRLLAYNQANDNLEYLSASQSFDRISLYFSMFQIVIIGSILSKDVECLFDLLIKCGVMGIVIFLWVYDYAISNMHETIPYDYFFWKEYPVLI